MTNYEYAKWRAEIYSILEGKKEALSMPQLEFELKKLGNWDAHTFDVRDIIWDMVDDKTVFLEPGRLIMLAKLVN